MNRYAAVILLMVMSFSAYSSEIVTWVDGNTEHSYEIFDASTISWEDANAGLDEGWHLATITSQKEQDFVTANVTNDAMGEYWLGATQDQNAQSVEQGWSWVTGEDFYSYTNWAYSEPNDWPDGIENGEENHLAMWDNYGWDWNDEHTCGNISGYIAEKTTSVPEPNTMILLVSGLFGILGFAGIRRKK